MIENNPLISVIIPLFNTEKYIEECVNTICKQSYKNLEIIIINDGSVDNSKAICERCAVTDERITIISQKNSGVTIARNQGIRIAKGKYICFVDSDDTISYEMIDDMYKSIIENGTDASVQIKCSIFQNNNYSQKMKADECIKQLCLLRYPTSMCAYLYSASIVKKITIDDRIHYFEDFLFNHMFLSMAENISVVSKLYYNYRVNPEGINHSSLGSKKMSCLDIYDLISEKARKNKYVDELQFFRSHCLIAVIIAAAKLEKISKDIYIKLKDEARKILKDILGNKNISVKYKILIWSTAYYPRLTLILLDLLLKIRK